MSADFIEDACEALHTEDTRHVLIAWVKDSRQVHRSAWLANKEQVAYARMRINELLDELEERLEE